MLAITTPIVVGWLIVASNALAATLDVADVWRWSGDFGLGAASLDGQPAYVETDTPAGEKRLVVRFYFNAAAPTFGLAGPMVLLRAVSGTGAEILKVVVQPDGQSTELVYTVATDTATTSTVDIPVSAGWHFLELDWAAATAMGANDGSLFTRLDNEPTAGLMALDNDSSTISALRWGAVETATAHTGTLRLDDFASSRAGPIGPVLAGSLDIDGDSTRGPLTDGLLLLRAMFGFTGTTLTTSALGAGCDWCTSATLLERHVALLPVLDIDDNGTVDALTDALLAMRYLFGFRGAALIVAAVGAGAQRDTAAEIEAYIASLL